MLGSGYLTLQRMVGTLQASLQQIGKSLHRAAKRMHQSQLASFLGRSIFIRIELGAPYVTTLRTIAELSPTGSPVNMV